MVVCSKFEYMNFVVVYVREDVVTRKPNCLHPGIHVILICAALGALFNYLSPLRVSPSLFARLALLLWH